MPSLDLPFWPGWTAEGYYVPSAKGAPRPRCLGRIERIGETERLTAPAPRPEKPSDAEARPLRGMHWEGRWALISQDDAGSLEIPLDAPSEPRSGAAERARRTVRRLEFLPGHASLGGFLVVRGR